MSRETARTRGGRTSDAGNAIEKAMRILEAATGDPGVQSLGDIAGAAQVPKATAYRILSTLTDMGFVIRQERQGYLRGPRMRALGQRVVSGRDAIDDVLSDLVATTGQTAHFGLKVGDGAVYTHKLEADQPYKMASYVGMSLDMHCTAIGKSILSHLGADEVRRVVESTGLPRRTDRTITTASAFDRELAVVRDRGFAYDDEENERTIRCIGAPCLSPQGIVHGAVSVSTVVFLVEREELESWSAHVVQAAARIAGILQGGVN